jgi:DDE superfamily endonuclease
MAARYALRKTPWLDACQVAPEIFAQVIPRLYPFMKPFVTIFHGQGDDPHATTSVCGLLSDIEPKNSEALASRFGPSRLPLQGFIGWQEWADEPLRQELRRQVKTPWGPGEGGWVCDPSGLPTAGGESVGVARQWGGRLGKVAHCHVALSMDQAPGPSRQRWRAARVQRLPHAAPVGLGDVGHKRRRSSA